MATRLGIAINNNNIGISLGEQSVRKSHADKATSND